MSTTRPVNDATTKEQAASEAAIAASPTRRREVLVVNREPELRTLLNKALCIANLSSTCATSLPEAASCFRKGSFGLVILGIESQESLDFLASMHAEFPEAAVLGLARTASPDLVRDVLRAGATDFLFGSLDSRVLSQRLLGMLEQPTGAPQAVAPPEPAPVAAEDKRQDQTPVRTSSDYGIVCSSKRMIRLLEIVKTISVTDSTALIQGESGTGKELIAKTIHGLSKRAAKPFVEVNCGALPESLLESQLFGHEKGSFTGAVQRQIGLFEIADKGTLFLDEIGEMSLDMQVKLLRVLQFQEFRRIGGSQVVKVDVRVIAATNKDLKVEVESRRFRSDLFYRLNVIGLDVPPLRERLEEIPELVKFFSERITQAKGVPQTTFSPDAVARLQKYRWTGNIRELENAVERLILLSKKDKVEAADLDEHLGQPTVSDLPSPFLASMTLDDVKRIHIANVLHEAAGNKMKTARILRINVKTLYNLMRKLDIKE